MPKRLKLIVIAATVSMLSAPTTSYANDFLPSLITSQKMNYGSTQACFLITLIVTEALTLVTWVLVLSIDFLQLHRSRWVPITTVITSRAITLEPIGNQSSWGHSSLAR